MLLRTSCHLTFESPVETPMVLMLRPRSGDGQWVKSERYDVEPQVPLTEYTDLYGNLCQRLTAPIGTISIKATCEVEVADQLDQEPGAPLTPIEALPSSLLHFLLPSRYCESDRLTDASIEIAGADAPGYDQAERVRSWVHANVDYIAGASDSSTSAFDTWTDRQGVCRDQAHLAIALCRALDLPTRMVVGYLHGLEPMDLHAWYECFIGRQWFAFDPKEPTTLGGRVVVGYGRDAADVALATQFGPATLEGMQVTVEAI